MIKVAKLQDINIVTGLAIQLWEGNEIQDLQQEFTGILNNPEAVVYLKIVNGRAVGFAQCQLRNDYVEGTDSSPVGYLEGIYVEKKYRKMGYARQLLETCEKWAMNMGCTEFASDCELVNRSSYDFHMNVGFEEANRVICFTKKLNTSVQINFSDKLNKVKEYIKEIFKGESSGHDYWHSIRVYNNARIIAEKENCNEQIVALAALLHDVDDRKLFQTENYENATNIMSACNIKIATQQAVIYAISMVSFDGVPSEFPITMEGKIVQDADRLDAIGAIGIARAFAFGGSRGRQIYDPDVKPRMKPSIDNYAICEGTTINHFYEKLFLLKDRMNTDTAKKMADERDAYMHQFMDEFEAEIDGMR